MTFKLCTNFNLLPPFSPFSVRNKNIPDLSKNLAFSHKKSNFLSLAFLDCLSDISNKVVSEHCCPTDNAHLKQLPASSVNQIRSVVVLEY